MQPFAHLLGAIIDPTANSSRAFGATESFGNQWLLLRQRLGSGWDDPVLTHANEAGFATNTEQILTASV